ncbi:hypothetical protein IQ276_031360 [Desmonostoc muscorum LEGE 12446]|uniref:Uncharacterized protein n=1 Tax=Desmonostoc muscorum LEGE 12446 TaxID=1828758 RepID=A0A8J7AEL3_DESMC|nr:hypothetical protein [Desmonostoc muscorum]MCF2150844.1 hypothetical protein [Desmonostoc muscorum LEGE 12446]
MKTAVIPFLCEAAPNFLYFLFVSFFAFFAVSSLIWRSHTKQFPQAISDGKIGLLQLN